MLKSIRAERGDNMLFLDGGDTWQGSYTSLETRGQDMVDVMNALKPDAMTSHWEFTYGIDRVREIVDGLPFAFLGGNIFDNEWDEPAFDATKMFERGRSFNAGEITARELDDAARAAQVLLPDNTRAAINQSIRQRLLDAAIDQQEGRAAWREIAEQMSLPPPGALRATFGLDLIAEASYSLYQALRQQSRMGFRGWSQSVFFRKVYGDPATLSPERLNELRQLHREARTELRRIRQFGRRAGMSEDEMLDYVRSWAKRGDSTDDVLRRMRDREIVIDRTSTTGRVRRGDLPPGGGRHPHRGAVRITGPNDTYVRFLPLDELDRPRGVVARVDSAFLDRATGAHASGDIVGRASTQDRAHLLARVLGGPDIPQNLAPLLRWVNQVDMRIVEVAIEARIRTDQAVRITVVPRYAANRLDPEFLMVSLRWSDGTHQVFPPFRNP